MAALVRSSALLQLRKNFPRIPREVRLISTSKKNSDTATVTPTTAAEAPHDFSKPDPKNWLSYGFSYTDKEEDSNHHHASFFMTVSVVFILGGCIWAYAPDVNMRNWASREAYLEIRRREAAGLPLVDKNYVDPALMILPTDEELGDTEIII